MMVSLCRCVRFGSGPLTGGDGAFIGRGTGVPQGGMQGFVCTEGPQPKFDQMWQSPTYYVFELEHALTRVALR